MNAKGKHTEQKPRVAFWGAGIFPDKQGSKGIPVFAKTIEKLSHRYEYVLYSHLQLRKDEVPSLLKVRQPPRWCGRRLAYVFLLVTFMRDHGRKRYAMLHAHSSYPDPTITTLLGIIFRIPVIIGYNAAEFIHLPEIDFGDLKTFKGRLNRWVVNHCDRVVALSFFQAATIRNYMRFPEKLHIIYRGILQTEFPYHQRAMTVPLKLIQVAYHHAVKDQLTLLKAFNIVRQKMPALLQIVGPDFWNGTVKNEIERLKLNDLVTLKDQVPHTEIGALLNGADFMVHTARYDASAVAVIEAMSCGVVVVGTRVGIIADLENECCIAVDPGDADALADKILSMANDQEACLRLRERALDWTRQHDLDSVVESYSHLYEALMHGN
jgi:glycosyltransferase involved in cell wall biosynthesis